MIYILFLALCCMFITAYLINQKDILSPWVITTGMFLVSTFFAILNIDNWNFRLSPLTVCVILAGVFAFGIGEMLITSMFEKYPAVKVKCNKEIEYFNIPYWILIFIISGMIAGLGVMIKQTYEMSLRAGNTEGILAMLEYARRLYIQPGNTIGRASIHISLIGKAVSAVFLYFFINNLKSDKHKKKDFFYLIPVVLYLGMAALGTGRTFMIEFLGMCVIFYFFIESRKIGWGKFPILRVFAIAVAALCIFFIFFFLFGYVTGKSQGTKLFDMISVYTGMSIPSFDHWLNKAKDISVVFGEETLYGVTSVLRRLGLTNLKETVRHLEFVDFGSSTGNVYTCLRRYINDYGYIGMILIQTAVGAFYSLFYNNLKRGRAFGILLIFYGILAYPLFMQSIDELILSSYLSTSYLYLTVYILLVYGILTKVSRKLDG